MLKPTLYVKFGVVGGGQSCAKISRSVGTPVHHMGSSLAIFQISLS